MSGRVHTESVEDDNSLSYTNKPLPVDLFFKTFEGPKNALKGGQSNQSQMSLKESPIFFFALGLAYYMVLFVTLSHMLPTNKAIPKDLHPVFFLFVAPSSVAAMAWAKIQGCSSQSFQRIQILTFMVGLHISDEHVVWEDIHEQRALNVFLVVGDCVLVGFQAAVEA
ncbi:S-type anion channel SLAH3 [Glycine soja]|uniref:S-type anion channel SLAH3 n=1 Tax=Glycine soja TaxID=3848 RepID=A0A0B2NWT7_GLYSO|nr:S-type anion channel SLAH3 [Glycine soja]